MRLRTPQAVQARVTERNARCAWLSAAAVLLALAPTTDGFAARLASAGSVSARTTAAGDWPPLGLPAQPVTSTSWIAHGLEHGQRFRLSAPTDLGLLARHINPSIDRPAAWQSFYRGRFGAKSWQARPTLAWADEDHADEIQSELLVEPFAELSLALHPFPEQPQGFVDAPALPNWALYGYDPPEPQWVGLAPAESCPPWRQARPVTLMRYDGERDTFRLLDCNGAIAPDAIDRLSAIARLPRTERPELPLPLEPQPAADEQDEWLPGLRMVHPRLVWLVQRFADEFPNRPILIVSGYRRDRSNTHHRRGRALDLFVLGVPNEDAFRFCRKLHDVGCGYYPNHAFIHADVRSYGSGHPMWIDLSEPGMPSRYVDSWPGLVEGDALMWGEQ